MPDQPADLTADDHDALSEREDGVNRVTPATLIPPEAPIPAGGRAASETDEAGTQSEREDGV